MSPEAQRIAIAEFCGWRPDMKMKDGSILWDTRRNGEVWGMKPHPSGFIVDCKVPNYCNDLNAMHEAVSFLRNSNRFLYSKYASMLDEIVARYNSDPAREPYRSIATCDATAAQRAEALYHIITCPQT